MSVLNFAQNIANSSGAGQSTQNATSTWGGSSANGSTNSAQAWSMVDGYKATLQSMQNALDANTSAMQAWKESADYNREEAQKQRAWQEEMANTQYQRSVKDMIAAGLNPILAASNGIQTASVGTGAVASTGTPNSFMAQSIADQNSASTSYGSSWGKSSEGGSSYSEGQSSYKNGIANFVDNITDWINGIADQTTAAEKTAESQAEVVNYIYRELERESGPAGVGLGLGALGMGLGFGAGGASSGDPLRPNLFMGR